MPFTQNDIDNLKAAMATGAKEATIEGRHMVFRDLEEMDAILTRAEREVLGTGVAPAKQFRFYTSKGLT